MNKFEFKPQMASIDERRIARLNMGGVMIGDDYIDEKENKYIPGVTADMFRHALESCADAERIDITLTSYGGSLPDALDMVDAIKASSVPVYIEGHSTVASAATLLMVAAAHSSLAPSCTFMLHHPVSRIQGTPGEIEAYNENFKHMFERAFELYSAKCGKSVEQIMADTRDGKWFTADDAVAYGLVDEVMATDDDKEEAPRMALPKSGMLSLYAAGAAMGISYFQKKMEVHETDALKHRVAELETHMAAMKTAMADSAAKMADFDSQVKAATMAALAEMGVEPDKLPPADEEPVKKPVMLSGSMEDMLRASN